MNQYAVICLDNNPISIERIRIELAPLSATFDIYTAEDLDEAHQALKDIHDNPLAIVHATGQVFLTKKTGENNE